MIKTDTSFLVTQLDNSWACSSLLFKNMGPKIFDNTSRLVLVEQPDVFFQMFDNLFRTKNPDGSFVVDKYDNHCDLFAQNIGTSAYRPFQYGFFIFYCAHAQIDTTGTFLESLGCSVQKTFAKKTGNLVALYVIESGKFLDQYETWREKAKSEGHEVFGTPRTKGQK